MALTLVTDDANDQGEPDALVTDGLAAFNEAENCWVATIDWHAIRYASEQAAAGGMS